MSLPKQVLLLCALCLVAICIAAVLPIAIPSSVIAMLLVLCLLLGGVLKPPHLDGIAKTLQSYMGFFFVPTCVSVLEELEIIKESGLIILILCVLGTIGTFGVTALTTTCLLKLWGKKSQQPQAAPTEPSV